MSTSPNNDGDSSGGAAAGPEQSTISNSNSSRPPPQSSKKFACVLCRRRKLKCDGAKPACGTCSRLKHHCTYQDDAPKKPGVKRRNIKDLEARLAQVEGKLTQEKAKSAANANAAGATDGDISPDQQWSGIDGDMDWNPELDNDTNGLGLFNSTSWPVDSLDNDFFGASMLPMGLQEALPPQNLIDELHNLYFGRINQMMPMIHEGRYRAALASAPHMRPAVCLRYAMWAVTASVVESYNKYKDVFYARARMYAEIDELKGHGESFVTIQHAQTWTLLGNYEVRNTAFPRAWMSNGRAVRLCQMMGLDRLDNAQANAKKTLPPARDWTELEERRRTFWAAFCGDRWSSAGTGWAMNIVEEDVMTNLPASEEAFRTGIAEETGPLASLFTAEGASRISTYSGVVLMAALFGHNIIHMHRSHYNDRPENYSSGEFWKRHRKMDNVLSTTAWALPKHMKLPAGMRDANVILINMNIHSSTICLHQAAISRAEEHSLDRDIIQRSQRRCTVSADEIVTIMRMCSHLDVSDMNPWVCFSLYVAAQVFLDGCKRKEDQYDQHRYNLEFVVGALEVIRHKHGIVEAFLAQLRLDMDSIGLLDESGLANHTTGLGVIGRPYVLALPKEPRDIVGFTGQYLDVGAISTYAAQQYRTAAALGSYQVASNQSSADNSDEPSNSATPSDTNDTPNSYSGSGSKDQIRNLPSRPSTRQQPSMNTTYPCPFVENNSFPLYQRSSCAPKDATTLSTNSYDEQVSTNSGQQINQDYSGGPGNMESQSDQNSGQHFNEFQNFDMSNQQFLDASNFSDFNLEQNNEALSAFFDEAQRQMQL